MTITIEEVETFGCSLTDGAMTRFCQAQAPAFRHGDSEGYDFACIIPLAVV